MNTLFNFLAPYLFVLEPLPIPVQTIKGPRTPAEKKKQPLLTPGSVYRSRIGDKLMSCKMVLQVGIVFSIVGNFVYFAFPKANLIVLARMISGLGWGLEGFSSFLSLFNLSLGALMGQIGRTYNQEDKTKSLALALITRQAGIIAGPLSVQFFENITFSFTVFGLYIDVNQHNFPGFLLCKSPYILS